jgi:chromatin remodeling complex protein RSC6
MSSKPGIDEAELRAQVLGLVKNSDLATMTKRKIRSDLEEHFKRDLTDYKAMISTFIEEAILECQNTSNAAEPTLNTEPRKVSKDQDTDDLELAMRLQEEENALGARPKRNTISLKKRSNQKKLKLDDASSSGTSSNTGKGGRGYPECRLTPIMAEFMNMEKATSSVLTKAIWGYIKEHKLQDANDGRWILCDPTLKSIFKKDKIHMFKIPGSLQAHLLRDYE